MSYTVFGATKSKSGLQGPRGIPGIKGEKGNTGDIGLKGKDGSTITDVEITQDEKTFSFKFVKSDDTTIVTDPLTLPFSDNNIPRDIVYITDIEIIPGVDQFSI